MPKVPDGLGGEAFPSAGYPDEQDTPGITKTVFDGLVLKTPPPFYEPVLEPV
jgi:hypothetical protein